MRACYLIIATSVMFSGCLDVSNQSSAEFDPQGAITLKVWPDSVEGQAGGPTETVKPDEGDNIIRLTDVSVPSMTVYKAEGFGGVRPVVLVCPGGGYTILAIDLEGTEVAEWLNSIGVTAVVLKYRVPANHEGAFADVQRAMSLIHHNAKEWNVDPERVGVIGFSAGGNLCGKISTNFYKKSYEKVDEIDELSCRPDFAMLVYPYLFGEGDKRAEKKLDEAIVVNKNTPRTILIHAQDDWVKAENSILYYLELKKAKIPSELHIFPSGGHGYGLRKTEHAVSGWPKLCESWMKKAGILD